MDEEKELIITIEAIVEEMRDRIPTVVSIKNRLYELKKPSKDIPPYLRSIVCYTVRKQKEKITIDELVKKFHKARRSDIDRAISYLIEQEALLQVSNDTFKVLPKLDDIYRSRWGVK